MARDPRLILIVSLVISCAASARGWLERLPIERDVRALVSSDRVARRGAARRLGREGAQELAVDALLAALERETDPDVRAEIVDALARRRDPRAIEALSDNVLRLRDEEREARVRALAAIDLPLARRALAAALGGPAAELASAGLIELGGVVVDEVARLLDVPAIAPRAAMVLGRIGDRSGVEALLARAQSDDVDTRVAVIDALGIAGDERASPVVLAAISDGDARVAIAALHAIARIGGRHASDAVAAQVGREEVSIAAIEALAVIDPARAAPLLDEALASHTREAAWSVMVGLPDVAFVALLARAADDERTRGAACDALARIAEGAGVEALRAIASRHEDAHAALAIALRRWRDLEGSTRESALRVIAAGDGDRALLLRAVARDGSARAAIRARLASDDADARAIAARALAMLGDGDDALTRAIGREDDAVALEIEIAAAVALGMRIPAPSLAWLDDRERAAAALQALSIAPEAELARDARDRRRAMLAALRSDVPRLRAVAATSLARRGDERARVAIAALLEDGTPEVRLAAASALARLDGGRDAQVVPAIASRLAIEPEPRVRRALLDALRGVDASATGATCLHARLDRAAAIDVEIVLADGTWLRERTLPSGELVVCDLAHADADVRLAP
ncbi:HEAT repeat domain-containing protein [Sandaracinus amylolyticus]|uniref:TPR domain protein, putative component of TonB system n=1 Tax=Sandaracinus amylolyticus TaxID=927083 RepID=A0A0F6YG61_9BACT|nr:HEAT repeat domain-containing protein [Sandaracinus amylolyticus]AKF03291.1 TPR domain protein, putative component of TonB system [Sandaracinus amylolyticus]